MERNVAGNVQVLSKRETRRVMHNDNLTQMLKLTIKMKFEVLPGMRQTGFRSPRPIGCSLSIFTALIVFVGSFFVSVNTAKAVVIDSYDFEDGRIPTGDSIGGNAKVPPTILTESNGNHFLRMTASPEDCGGQIFGTACPTARSGIQFGSFDRTAYNPLTFSFSYRLRSPIGGNLIAQFYQTNNVDTGGWVVGAYADGAGVVGVEVKNPLSN